MKNISTDNLKPLILSKLKSLVKECPDYSMSEILYTILRRENLPNKPSSAKTGWLLHEEGSPNNITDRDIYTAINNALINEYDTTTSK